MTTSIFYTSPDNITREIAMLDGLEAKHARDVMRLKKGNMILVVDGIGNAYRCEILKSSKANILSRIISKIRNLGEPNYFVTLAAGLSTGFKFDEIVRRTTELGISRFIPLVTQKSKIKIDTEKKQKTKLNRWRKVAVASMKQSGRSFLPEILPITQFNDIFSTITDDGKILLFDPNHADRNIESMSLVSESKSCTLIIGPESGFTREEVEIAGEKGCEVVSLGPRILRTENASPTAVALVMHLLGEFR